MKKKEEAGDVVVVWSGINKKKPATKNILCFGRGIRDKMLRGKK